MQLYPDINAFRSQFQVPRLNLATHGFSLEQVARCAEVSPKQLAVSIERGWFPDGEIVDGRKVWHPEFLLAFMCMATTEKVRGELPKSWPIADGYGPFHQSHQPPSAGSIAHTWQSFPMDAAGTISILVFPEITKVYFTRRGDSSEGWEIQQVAAHFNVTVGQLRRSIEHGVFPDARLVDGRMIWLPGFIPMLTDITDYLKSTGRLSPSWPVMPGNWGDTPTRQDECKTKTMPKARRHFKKRKAA